MADEASVRLVRRVGPTIVLGTDLFGVLDLVGSRTGLAPDVTRDRSLPPLSGGLVGALSYDLARQVERLPCRARADRGDLWAQLALGEVVVATDGEVCLVLERPLLDGPPDPGLDDVIGALASPAPVPNPPRPEPQTASTTLPSGSYQAVVQRVLEHIAAGDVFQTNVTQRLTARWPGQAHDLYRALRDQSPAPHGAVVERSGIASISPETFLHAEGVEVTVRPIKGTRPRASEPGSDLDAARALESSEKDRAENVMVVDMERNDLGRVCLPGTVQVPQLLTIEAHPTVWHLVSTVRGQLRPGTGWGGLLRATFPCGSVTGTPKVRAMQLIEELEPVRRSWYCGAIGFLSAGAADTSVAIRTAVLRGGWADYGAGGGVVAESDTNDEYAESLAKGAAFLSVTNASLPTEPPRR